MMYFDGYVPLSLTLGLNYIYLSPNEHEMPYDFYIKITYFEFML